MRYFMTVFACLALAVPTANASVYFFAGSDEGGTGSGELEFLGEGTASLTVNIDNTSPLTLDDSTGVNAPGITGFGFDSGDDPIPSIVSWTLFARDANLGTGSLVQIGGTSSVTNDWILTVDGSVQGIQLDFFPNLDDGVKGALYNPDQTSGFAALPNYFTDAVLSIEFNSAFSLDVHGPGTGGVDASPLMRFQNVGLNGEGSLKLGGGIGGPPDPPGNEIPEPASVLVWALLVSMVTVSFRRRR